MTKDHPNIVYYQRGFNKEFVNKIPSERKDIPAVEYISPEESQIRINAAVLEELESIIGSIENIKTSCELNSNLHSSPSSKIDKSLAYINENGARVTDIITQIILNRKQIYI